MNKLPLFKKGWIGGKTELRITSPMGMRKGRMHQGIDIGVVVGTYIEAPFNGIVVSTSKMSGYGLQLELRCKINESTTYTLRFAHLNKIADGIKAGNQVKVGTKIAYTGGAKGDPNAGSSTGPHLHLEVIFGGKRLNPCYFLTEKLIVKGKLAQEEREQNAAIDEQEAQEDNEDNYTDFDIAPFVDESATEEIIKKRKKAQTNNQRTAPGIWQIVKLLMDSSVKNRQIVDSSISMMTGNLQSWFNKVCQEPLVEFSGDTFGDEYFFFVRKPPFDLEGINKGMEYMLTIPECEIISENLSWNTQNIYSWYQYIPYAETMGMENITMYMPAIFFPEYASVWGSRDLTVRSQYVSLFNRDYGSESEEKKKKGSGENIMRNCISDLKYIIDCNAYNPFVRSGTITLNGDRRIKRGTFILMPNNEVFYVDAVNNTLSIGENSYSRRTTLTVSHGMFLPFINGVEINDEKISYFNIIDYGEGFSIDKLKEGNYSELISKWKVNFNVFAFFLRKEQMFYNE